MEKYRPVNDYEGIYEVNDQGIIRTVKGKTTYTVNHGLRHWKQRILKQKTDRDGYKRVTLWKDGKAKDYLVHRIVAQVFIDNPDRLKIVNHLDGNPSNNCIENLEWTNYHGNLIHAYLNGLNESAQSVVLVSKDGEAYYFYSKSSASKFLNRNHGYISNKLKSNKTVIDGYKVFIPVKF